MEITVELPNDLAQHEDPPRAALEALAIAGYRSGKLSHFQASRLLGLTQFECFKARLSSMAAAPNQLRKRISGCKFPHQGSFSPTRIL